MKNAIVILAGAAAVCQSLLSPSRADDALPIRVRATITKANGGGSVAAFADSSTILTVNSTYDATILDATTAAIRNVRSNVVFGNRKIAFTPDAKTVVAAGPAGVVAFSFPELVSRAQFGGGGFAISQDGLLLAAGGESGGGIYELPSGRSTGVDLPAVGASYPRLSWTSDNRLIVGGLFVVSAISTDGQEIFAVSFEAKNSTAISASPSTGAFAQGTQWGALRMFSAADGRLLWHRDHSGVIDVKHSRDGRFLLMSEIEAEFFDGAEVVRRGVNRIILWRAADGARLCQFPTANPVTSIDFSPDNTTFAFTLNDESLTIAEILPNVEEFAHIPTPPKWELEKIAESHSVLPRNSDYLYFDKAVVSGGNIAFNARGQTNAGIYLWRNGQVDIIADKDAPLPGTTNRIGAGPATPIDGLDISGTNVAFTLSSIGTFSHVSGRLSNLPWLGATVVIDGDRVAGAVGNWYSCRFVTVQDGSLKSAFEVGGVLGADLSIVGSSPVRPSFVGGRLVSGATLRKELVNGAHLEFSSGLIAEVTTPGVDILINGNDFPLTYPNQLSAEGFSYDGKETVFAIGGLGSPIWEIYKRGPGGTVKIVDLETLAPGTTNKFSQFESVQVRNGRVAFYGQWTGGSGVFVWDHGQIDSIVRTDRVTHGEGGAHWLLSLGAFDGANVVVTGSRSLGIGFLEMSVYKAALRTSTPPPTNSPPGVFSPGSIPAFTKRDLPGDAVAGTWADFDGDNDVDLSIAHGVQTAASIALLRNDAGQFTNVATQAGVSASALHRGVAWADFDNDGRLDFVDTKQGVCLVYRQNVDATFTPLSDTAFPSPSNSYFGAAWADYDRDGFVDLCISGILGGTILYHNNGNGSFSVSSGLSINRPSASWGLAWLDYNNDTNLDLFIGNFNDDGTGTPRDPADQFFRNNGDGTFSFISDIELVRDGAPNTGAAAGDYDNDGDFDLFVTDDSVGQNRLYRNNGDTTFSRITDAPMVNETSSVGTSTGCLWADFDNDGWLDLFVANHSGENDLLYRNNGDGTFTAVTESAVTSDAAWGIGCAAGDFDDDGFQDLFVANFREPSALYCNAGNSNHWLKVKCIGTRSNRSAIGAVVKATARINGNIQHQYRMISSGNGYVTQGSLEAHFGLGAAASADVEVTWPTGARQRLAGVAPNQTITIRESDPNAFKGEIVAVEIRQPVILGWPIHVTVQLRNSGTVAWSTLGESNILVAFNGLTWTTPISRFASATTAPSANETLEFELPLPHEGPTLQKITITAALHVDGQNLPFDGAPFELSINPVNPAATLQIQLLPSLMINGISNGVYRVEIGRRLSASTNWNVLTDVTLTNVPYRFIDMQPADANAFYRATYIGQRTD